MYNHRLLYVAIVLGLSLSLSGCVLKAALVEPTASGIVNDGLSTLNKKQNRQHLKALLGVVDTRAASSDLAQGAVAGALDELAQQKRREQVKAAIDEFVSTSMAALAKSAERDIGPAMRRETEKLLRESATVLLSASTRAEASAVTAAATRGVTGQLTSDTRQLIGPSVAYVVERNIMPAVGTGLTNSVSPALEEAAHASAYGAGIGLADALDGELGPAMETNAFAKVRQILDRGERILDNVQDGATDFSRTLLAIIAVLIAVLAVVSWLFRSYVGQLRKRESDVKAMEDALALVTTAISNYYAGERSQDLIQIVRDKSRRSAGGTKSEAGACLADFLDTRPHFKVKTSLTTG